jgi:hypothetical protein
MVTEQNNNDIAKEKNEKEFTSITVPKETWKKLKDRSKSLNTSLAKLIEQLLDESAHAPILGRKDVSSAAWKWPGPYTQVVLDPRVTRYKSTAWVRTQEYVEKVLGPQWLPSVVKRVETDEEFELEMIFILSKESWGQAGVWDWITRWLTMEWRDPKRVHIYVVEEKSALEALEIKESEIDNPKKTKHLDMGIYGEGLVGFLEVNKDSSIGPYTWIFNLVEIEEAKKAFEKIKAKKLSQGDILRELSRLQREH